jgi:hypothetical protein
MTDKPSSPPAETQVSCHVCHKEIPLSAALTPEGAAYVEHFCGVDCYQKFIAEAKKSGTAPST